MKWPRCPVASRWSSSTRRASVEQVDHRLAVAAHGQPGSRGGQRPGRADPVGQVRLGGRAEAGERPAAADQLDVPAGQVGGVDHRGARAEQTGRGQHAGRGVAVGGQAGLVLGGLLGQVRVHRRPVRLGPGQHRRQLIRRHRADRVDRGAEPGARAELAVLPGAQRGHPLGPAVPVAVAEPQLRPGQRHRRAAGVQPAGQVAGVQQGDPYPGLAGGLQQRLAHLVRVGVPAAAGAVVQVVELAHAGDAGQRHLGVDRAGQGQVGVRVQPRGGRVHLLPPGPERAPARLRAAAQRPVERVRVAVGEAGQGQPGQPLRSARLGRR